MFQNWQKWYITDKVDEIVQEFCFHERDDVAEIFPRFFHKTDNTGKPLMFQQYHKLDAQVLYKLTTNPRLLTDMIRENEKIARYRFPACSLAKETHVEQMTVIFDLKNAPMLQFPQLQEFVAGMSQISSDYHPETLGRVFLINAPFGFSTVWYVIQNLIAAETAAKVKICGADFIPTLLEFIPAESLPKQYGGTCECEGGCEKQDVGPWNDGSVAGYPDTFWEGFKKRDEDAKVKLLEQAALPKLPTLTLTGHSVDEEEDDDVFVDAAQSPIK
ncbi:cytosolic factor, phosphatidylinositol/phosphatidylcholine transfer protein [Podochytrium sp. JEL0797]|nr:cytosolic factor, phosphatidylinositol/phosphatidylcholine transfer protein [Podochytrium sp. JEL0797]